MISRPPDPSFVAFAHLHRYAREESPGQVDKATLNAFMSDYYGMTHPNPIDPRMRVWSYAKADTGEPLPLILTEMEPFWGYILFKAIISPEKQGTGQASYILKKITDLADKHGVAMTLTAKPFGTVPNALSKSKLMGWYKRHGWEARSGRIPGDMIRFPR